MLQGVRGLLESVRIESVAGDNGIPQRDRALVVVAKAPIAGLVKTRLCPPLTLGEAALFYECLLVDIAEKMERHQGSDSWLAFAPGGETYFRQKFAGQRLIGQRGKDLGERLHHIFVDLFGQGYKKIVVADSDSPTVPLSTVDQAYGLLDQKDCDMTLGPSCDGGYYLIGLKRAQAELFDGIPWSTVKVMKKTLMRARALGLKATLLPLAYDIDTTADLERLRSEFARFSSSRKRAPRSFAYLMRFFRSFSSTDSTHPQTIGGDRRWTEAK
jgi:rSAM/selenodomain-associated transferase 1